MEPSLTPESQNVASIRGAQTGWLEAGSPDKPILFFLHGYPDTPESWTPQLEYFKDRFHVIAPYSRGSAPSTGAGIDLSRYGSESVALDHLKILDIVDPDRKKPIFIVGHDIGVVQAWFLAHLLGDQLKGLCVINGLSLPQMAKRMRNLRQNVKSWYIYLFQIPFLADRVLKRSPGKFLNYAYRKGGLAASNRPKVKESVKGVVGPINQYRALFRGMPNLNASKGPRLKAPVQLLWGDGDPFLLTPKAEELRPFARDFEIRILSGGHWIHLDQPELVNELIDEFTQKNLPKDAQ